MKILFLGYTDSPLIDYIREHGDEVLATDQRIDLEFLRKETPEFLVSYGYKFILKRDVLDFFKGRAINLHISYLPWNRGYYPNFWSFVENTPKGVTVHLIDEGVDTGDILVQKGVDLKVDGETFRTTYDKLREEMQVLFKESWLKIRDGEIEPRKQTGPGSFHFKRDIEPLWKYMDKGWDTPIGEFLTAIKKAGLLDAVPER